MCTCVACPHLGAWAGLGHRYAQGRAQPGEDLVQRGQLLRRHIRARQLWLAGPCKSPALPLALMLLLGQVWC